MKKTRPSYQSLSTKRIFHALLVIVGAVAVWRGVWGLFDLYLVPQFATLSFVLSTLLGLGILYYSKDLFKK